MPRLSAPRATRGFTLVELIVTLAILAVVGTLVVRVGMAQQRFHHQAAEQMRMRRELRATMQLVPTDLRSVSSAGGDIMAFAESGLTFRAVFGSSVICSTPSSTIIDIPPTGLARTTLTHFASPPLAGDTVWAFDDSTSSGAEDDRWVPLEIAAVTTLPDACTGSPYLDPALDAGKAGLRLALRSTLPSTIPPGSGVRFTRPTRYQLDPQPSGRWYLTRSEHVDGDWTAAAPVSGPFIPPSSHGGVPGVRFTYFDSTGRTVTDPMQGTQIARIDLRLTTTGMASSDLAAQGTTTTQDSIGFRIALRNRQ